MSKKEHEELNEGSDNQDWHQYRMFVVNSITNINKWLESLTKSSNQMLVKLGKLDTVNEDINELKKDSVKMKEDIADLKTKAGVWGAVAGLIPVLVALGIAGIYWFLNGK